jgi:hypothetical protein
MLPRQLLLRWQMSGLEGGRNPLYVPHIVQCLLVVWGIYAQVILRTQLILTWDDNE